MPVDDLVTLLPALGVVLPSGSSLQGGTLSADLTAVGPVDKLLINGPVKLVNTKLAGFNMASKLAAIMALGGAQSGPDTAIQNFSSDVHVSPVGVQTQNVNLIVPSLGTVTGSGNVSPQNALDYKMSASLSGSRDPIYVNGWRRRRKLLFRARLQIRVFPDVKGISAARSVTGSAATECRWPECRA